MQCQIIDHDRHIAVGAIQRSRLASKDSCRRVHARYQPLRGSFFVAGGAVDLPRTPQPRHIPQFQAWPQGARIDVIVFDRIAGYHHLDGLKPFHAPHHRKLDFAGQRRADAIGIDEVRVQPFGLQENLVPIPIGKTVDLVLDGGTIARTARADGTGEKR